MKKKTWVALTIVLVLLSAAAAWMVAMKLTGSTDDPTVRVEHSTQRLLDAVTAAPTVEATSESINEPTAEPTTLTEATTTAQTATASAAPTDTMTTAQTAAEPTATAAAASTATAMATTTAQATAAIAAAPTMQPTAEPAVPVDPMAKGEPSAPLPLAGVKIGIDPGHQAKGNSAQEAVAPGSSETKAKVSSGTQGVATRTPEYVVNLEVSLALRDRLEELGAQVYMTRESHDVDISNIERATMMNELGVDLVLRIHCNGSTNSSHKGISLFVKPDGAGAEESYAAAEALLPAMVDATGAKSLGIYVRDTYSGLNWSEVPSILVEMGFMSNVEEDKLLCDAEYQMKLVKGMAQGIADYMERELPPED